MSNPGCNHMQTPRVGYDMPGQGKAAMADSNLYPWPPPLPLPLPLTLTSTKATMEYIVRMYARRCPFLT